MIYCGHCREEIKVGDSVSRLETGLVYESSEGDKCGMTDCHAVFLYHRGGCPEKGVEALPERSRASLERLHPDEMVTMHVRTYRLNVGGTVRFMDADKALEELFLAGKVSPQRTERAIQSLEEEATELHVELTRI